MQFYPHNISTSLVGLATSASLAKSGSLINNFAAIAINTVVTASLALNITGSTGTSAPAVEIPGPRGLKGDKGVKGFRGKSIFLLSGSWNTGTCSAPIPCYSYNFGNASGTGPYTCDAGTQTTYYSTATPLAAGSPMFFAGCLSSLNTSNIIGAYDGKVWNATAGELTYVDDCSSGGTPPECTGTCGDEPSGPFCAEGCVCSGSPTGVCISQPVS